MENRDIKTINFVLSWSSANGGISTIERLGSNKISLPTCKCFASKTKIAQIQKFQPLGYQ
jgi:hypothetical protein